MDSVERFAAERLAKVLDDAARVLADAAQEFERLASSARKGAGAAGYAYLASKAHSTAVSALPNLGLPQAFEMAALADQYRGKEN